VGRSIADRRLESKVYKVSSGEINAANAADLGVEIKGTEGHQGK